MNNNNLDLELCIKFFKDLTKFLEELQSLRGVDKKVQVEDNESFNNNFPPIESWPDAISSELLDSKNFEMIKSNSMLNELFLNQKINVLDFGCGEGFLVQYLLTKNIRAIGFDINKHDNELWNQNICTDSFQKIKDKSPYDLIVIYDVLDHSINPVDILKQASNMLEQNGRIFMRCHPWCSRHGGHINQKNKAFLHLIYKEDELKNMGLQVDFNQKVLYPINTYETWIKQASLVIKNKNVERQSIENFFLNNVFFRLKLMNLFESNEFPKFQMEQNFLDFVCVKKS